MPNHSDQLDEGSLAERRGELDRARVAYEHVVDGSCPDCDRAVALVRLANLHRNRCEFDQALARAREGQAVARRAKLPDVEAEGLNAEAVVHQTRGDFAEARRLLEGLLRLTSDHRLRGIALQNLGVMAAESGSTGDAERYFSESYGCFMRAGFRRGELFALNNYGRAALDRSDVALAFDLLDKAVELARTLEDSEMVALTTLNLAETLLRREELERVEDLVSESLGYFATTGNSWRQIECLRLLGDLHARAGTPAVARRCYEDGLSIAARIGARMETKTLEAALRGVAG